MVSREQEREEARKDGCGESAGNRSEEQEKAGERRREAGRDEKSGAVRSSGN